MKRFKHILCVVDSSETCEPILERAVTLAENNQAHLTVIDVIEKRISSGIGMPEDGPITAELKAAIVSAHTQKLETMVAPFRKKTQIETKVILGTPFLEIIHEVLRHGHDLVIKIPEHQDWLDRLFGSDDMHLLRKCPCPVWLIKSQAPTAFRRILAAVDVDNSYPPAELESERILNQQILEMASSLALSNFAELHIVHAWTAIGESTMRGALMSAPEEQVVDYVERIRKQRETNLNGLVREVSDTTFRDVADYLKPETHLVKGHARKVIPALAKLIDADLVVMGTVARTGIPGFIMGNTAETILNQLDCSVLAIKPAGFVTPVMPED